MKKLLLSSLVAGLMLAAPLATYEAQAQTATMKVGIIDVQRILAGSSLLKALQQAEQDVAAAEKKLIEFRDQKLQELQGMQTQVAQGKMTEQEFLNKKQEFERQIVDRMKTEQTAIERKKEEIRKMKESLEKDVEAAVNAIAKQKGLDMVINKQFVMYGGTDITGDVIKAMPKH